MQLEPKEEEEVDELQHEHEHEHEGAHDTAMDEDSEGQAAAATLMQASTSTLHAMPSATPLANHPSPSASSSATPAGAETSSTSQQQQEQQYAGPICANCSTQTTSLWRRSPEGQTLCNACSLYQKMKGTPRPVSLKTDVIKHRNRSKGDRKSAAAAAAAAKEKENSTNSNNASGTSTPTSSTPTNKQGKKAATGTSSAGSKARQASVAPSTASSVIREEDMEEDDPNGHHGSGNRSIAASTDGGDTSTTLQNMSSTKTVTANEESAQKKARTSLDHMNRHSQHHTPLTPGQLQAQQAAYNAAASRRPPNATQQQQHPHHPYNFYPHDPSSKASADSRAARARELAAAFALANAGGAGGVMGNVGRRAISVDGRSTPTHHSGHAPPIPWNIASYFSGMAERERQKQAAQIAASHSAAAAAATASSTANNTANSSRANTASQPNSAPSSATVSPTGTSIHDPPNTTSSTQTQAQQQAKAAAAAAASTVSPPLPPYTPHPHSNFLAAYRARQIASQQSNHEEYLKAKLEREKADREKVERERDSALVKGTLPTSTTNTAHKDSTALQQQQHHQKEWSPLVVSRTDPRLVGLNGSNTNTSTTTTNGSATTAADQHAAAARMAHLTGWRPPPPSSSTQHRDSSSTSASARSRHSSPSVNAGKGTDPRSASTSRAGSRHNTPPSSMPTVHPHPPVGATRLLFGLPVVYPRSASSDRLTPGSGGGRTISAAASGAGYPGGLRSFDNMSEEDREKQKARLDQLFAAAGQRLSAAQHQQAQAAAKNGQASNDGAGHGKIESAPVSATSTPIIKDLATTSESAVGRSPANTHHASYRPYDLAHRSSSRAASMTGHSSAPNSSILGPRTSPNHLNNSFNLGGGGSGNGGRKSERRPGSPTSQSSSSDHDASSNVNGQRKKSTPSLGYPGLDPALSPPYSSISYPGSEKNASVRTSVKGDDGMVIDENDEDQMTLEDQEGLDGLPSLRSINSSIAAHRDPASQSPPFGVTFGTASASERRGRSTTRKLRDGALGEDDVLAHQVGDHVAHELGALRMRDSSRSSSQIRSHSRSPDRLKNLSSTTTGFPELPRFSHISQMAHAQAMSGSGGYPRSSIPVADMDDGIVKNALIHRPISDLRASASPHPTLPSLSEALSSSSDSRSISASRTGSSRHSSAARTAMSHRSMMDEAAASGAILPPPNFGFDEAARLRTRVQELEFINGLMESRVAELENTITGNPDKAAVTILAPHGPNCSCRCSEIDSEALKAAEHLKKELLTHGVGGIGEQASRDLLDLLAHRLGYKPGAGASATTAGGAQSPAGSNGSYPIT